MRRLIINADDFGITDGVSRGIVEMLEEGSITSTTMMMAVDGCRERCQKYGIARFNGKVGVHLHLNNGRPLAGAENVPSLVDEQGLFLSKDDIPHFAPEDAKKEFRCQIEAAKETLGYMPSHIDSHYYLHTDTKQLPVPAAELAREYKLLVRRQKEATAASGMELLGAYATEASWTGLNLSEVDLGEKILAAYETMPEGEVLEVVCHPGYCDEALVQLSSLNTARENDMAMLRKLYRSGWYAQHGIELISFSEIARVD